MIILGKLMVGIGIAALCIIFPPLAWIKETEVFTPSQEEIDRYFHNTRANKRMITGAVFRNTKWSW